MILSPYGQQSFVEPNDYLTLSDKRRKEELDKLPSDSSERSMIP